VTILPMGCCGLLLYGDYFAYVVLWFIIVW
jgi:hypothetical protein